MKITKELLTLNQDIAGQEIGIPVYYVNCGKDDAPTVYIQSAVHAAEMQGSAVIFQLLTFLPKLSINTNFILVPNCNPFGRTQRAGEYLQGRFDATTGNNWNRFYHYDESLVTKFLNSLEGGESLNDKANEKKIVSDFRLALSKSIEDLTKGEWGINTAQYLNHKLQSLAVKADLVIDLHTGPSSTRHIYSPDFLVEHAKRFNIENIISIPCKFAGALDEASFIPWRLLQQGLCEIGVEFKYGVKAFTVELGSQENICLTQACEDMKGILNFLNTEGLVTGNPKIDANDITVTALKNYKTLFSKHAGMVEYLAKAGDKVEKGQTIARVLNSLEFDNDRGLLEIKSPSSGIVILHYPSAAVQVGTQLYKIATDA